MHSNTIGKSGANKSPNFSKMNGTTFGSIQRADMWKLGGSFEGYPEWYFTYSSMGGRWVTPVDRPADWIPSCEVVCTERLPGVVGSTSWTSPSIWGATVTCNQDDIMKFSALRLFPTTWHRYHAWSGWQGASFVGAYITLLARNSVFSFTMVISLL